MTSLLPRICILEHYKYTGLSVCLSVCLSVSLSLIVCVRVSVLCLGSFRDIKQSHVFPCGSAGCLCGESFQTTRNGDL